MKYINRFTRTASLVLGIALMTIAPSVAPANSEAQNSAGILAWVTMEAGERTGDSQMLSIVGHALALKPVKGRYSLEIKRKSKGGVSNTHQGGAVDLKPNATATLSRSAINVGAADTLDVELKIYVDEKEVFSASIKSVVDASMNL
jgi:hypothetical protein